MVQASEVAKPDAGPSQSFRHQFMAAMTGSIRHPVISLSGVLQARHFLPLHFLVFVILMLPKALPFLDFGVSA